MIRRHARLPVDLVMCTEFEERDSVSTPQYIEELKAKLAVAYDIASSESEAAATDRKKRYDRRVRGATVEVGDRVLVKNVRFRGKHNLANKFDEKIHVVVDQSDPNIPVYVVENDAGRKNRRVLHRNLLLPVNFLPLETIPKPTRRIRKPKRDQVISPDDQESTTDSESEQNSADEGATSIEVHGMAINTSKEIGKCGDDSDEVGEVVTPLLGVGPVPTPLSAPKPRPKARPIPSPRHHYHTSSPCESTKLPSTSGQCGSDM